MIKDIYWTHDDVLHIVMNDDKVYSYDGAYIKVKDITDPNEEIKTIPAGLEPPEAMPNR